MKFPKELLLETYASLVDARSDLLLSCLMESPVVPTATKFDQTIARLEAYAHSNGLFFWHEIVGEDDDCASVYTLEEIKTTKPFYVTAAEARFNVIEVVCRECPSDLVNEQRGLEFEARQNGLTFTRDKNRQRFVCTPLP